MQLELDGTVENGVVRLRRFDPPLPNGLKVPKSLVESTEIPPSDACGREFKGIAGLARRSGEEP